MAQHKRPAWPAKHQPSTRQVHHVRWPHAVLMASCRQTRRWPSRLLCAVSWAESSRVLRLGAVSALVTSTTQRMLLERAVLRAEVGDEALEQVHGFFSLV